MRILFATDFSEDADTAFRCIESLALPAGSRVRIVHAVEPVTTITVFAPTALLTLSEAAEEEARSRLRSLVAALEKRGVAAEAAVGVGRAADVIVDDCASFGPDLVVVGTRGRGAIATTVLGSVSAEIIDRAPCPVLVARRDRLATLVLAEDGTPSAAAGARAIAALPALATAAVTVVSVVDAAPPVLFADPTGSAGAVAAYQAWEDSLPELRNAHAAWARDRARELERAGVRATSECREGNVAAELIAAAKEHGADCIVVGSRGERGLRRLVLGSVARAVLHGAPCSVIVAHPRPAKTKPTTEGRESAAAPA